MLVSEMADAALFLSSEILIHQHSSRNFAEDVMRRSFDDQIDHFGQKPPQNLRQSDTQKIIPMYITRDYTPQ